MSTNAERLQSALTIALADEKFMGNNDKVSKAIEALTPKSTVSAVLKRLQGNALRDFLEKKDTGHSGYNDLARPEKIKAYVHDKFKTYMEDPKTSKEAIKLFNDAYQLPVAPKGIADNTEQQEAA